MSYLKKKLKILCIIAIKYKTLQNKFNQRDEKSVHWKLLNFMKEIKDTKMEVTMCLWNGRKELLRCSWYPMQSIDSMQISIIIPMTFFKHMEKIVLKFV
jgi:hypothetical protein